MSKRADRGEIVPGVYANPGAGPVGGDGITVEQADTNVGALTAELAAKGLTVSWQRLEEPTEAEEAMLMGGTRYSEEHDGRFPYRLAVNGRDHLLEMPGIPLEEVRYLRTEGQNPWNYPRLFLDGSSWLWWLALRVIIDEAKGEKGEA